MDNTILCGDVLAVLPTRLKDDSVNLCVSSPPYALQRRHLYGGVHPKDYPAWTVAWMAALRPKLRADASVLINIREHVRDGVIDDYVLRTRLALRDAGWFEIEELIWFAPDKPPLGSSIRPRRTWERVLWFAPSRRPYVDLYTVNRERGNDDCTDWRGVGANYRRGGNPAAYKSMQINIDTDASTYNEERRMGIRTGGRRRGKKFGDDLIHSGQGLRKKNPFARVTDLIRVPCGTIDADVQHPAMYPRGLPKFLIQTFSKPGDLVLDPFCGSGTTGLVAQELDRQFVGIDRSAQYCDLARRRLRAEPRRGKRDFDGTADAA